MQFSWRFLRWLKNKVQYVLWIKRLQQTTSYNQKRPQWLIINTIVLMGEPHLEGIIQKQQKLTKSVVILSTNCRQNWFIGIVFINFWQRKKMVECPGRLSQCFNWIQSNCGNMALWGKKNQNNHCSLLAERMEINHLYIYIFFLFLILFGTQKCSAILWNILTAGSRPRHTVMVWRQCILNTE